MRFHENSKLAHVFVILRFDAYMADEFGMKTDYIMVKKVVRSEEIACREVERLNRLKGDERSVYFWRSARLDREILLIDAPEVVAAESSELVPSNQQE
jgi:hypothetical protein